MNPSERVEGGYSRSSLERRDGAGSESESSRRGEGLLLGRSYSQSSLQGLGDVGLEAILKNMPASDQPSPMNVTGQDHRLSEGASGFSVGKRKASEEGIERVRKNRLAKPTADGLYSDQPAAPPDAEDGRCLAIDIQLKKAKSADEILNMCASDFNHFNHLNVATACHCLALKLNGRVAEEALDHLNSLAGKAVELASQFGTKQLATTLWSFARLGVIHRELFDAFALESVHKLK